jgi:hypothetical protein
MLPPAAGFRRTPVPLFDIRLFLIKRFNGPFGSMSRGVPVSSTNAQSYKINVPLTPTKIAPENADLVKVTPRKVATVFGFKKDRAGINPRGQSTSSVVLGPGEPGELFSSEVMGLRQITRAVAVWPAPFSASSIAVVRFPQGCAAVQLAPLPTFETYTTKSAAYEGDGVIGWIAATVAMTTQSFAKARIIENMESS